MKSEKILYCKGLGKSESEVSKWLGGTQNFTLKTIAMISAFLGEAIIIVPNANNKD